MNSSVAYSPIPLYHRVFGVLRQRILEGTYAAGAQLAPEDELAAEFKVSRATIRQAVGELVNTGLVSRQQGRGTFVQRTDQHALGQVFRGSLADLISETKRARIDDVSITHRTELPERIAASLRLDDRRGTIVRRARTMDGERFAYTINYLSPANGRLLTRAELKKVGLMQLLERRGITIAAATQSIRAQLSDVDVAANLNIELGAAVLSVERLLSDPRGEPVEFVQSWYRGDTYVYQVNLTRDGNGAGDMHKQFA